MSTDYLAKAAEKIDQWEHAIRDRNREHGWATTSPNQAEQIARAWIELAAIERGVAAAPTEEEQ